MAAYQEMESEVLGLRAIVNQAREQAQEDDERVVVAERSASRHARVRNKERSVLMRQALVRLLLSDPWPNPSGSRLRHVLNWR